MNSFYIFIMLIMIIFAGIMLVNSIRLFIKLRKIKNDKRKKIINSAEMQPLGIKENLRILHEEKDSTQLGKTFVNLMRLSYARKHIIINAGNKYDDGIQTKYFCEALTPEAIKCLYELRGTNG